MLDDNERVETQPVWKRDSPAIPVRENMKTSYLQLASMHGDYLPRLKKIDRPEISTKVRHYEKICQTAMMRNLNVMFKDHKHVMRKITRGQDNAYKTMCRVQRQKRKVQREECAKRHHEFRENMKSHRMRALLMNVVVKFRENVQRKKARRAAAEREKKAKEKEAKMEPAKPVPPSEGIERISMKQPDGRNKSSAGIKDNSTSSTSREQHQTEKVNDKDRTVHRERKGSLTKESKPKPEIRTAENRERWDSDYAKTDDEFQVVTKMSRAMEVSKSVSKPVTRTKGKDGREKSFLSETEQEEKFVTLEVVPPTEITQDPHPDFQKSEQVRSKRASIFVDESAPDFGWFTVGNPSIDESSNTSNKRSNTHSFTEECVEEGQQHISLPPIRTRRPGLARPPSSYIRDQLETFRNQDSNCRSSFMSTESVDLHSVDTSNVPERGFGQEDKNIYLELRPSHVKNTSDLDLRSSTIHGSISERKASSANGLSGVEERQVLSASCEPLVKSPRTNRKMFSGANPLLPVSPKHRSKKQQEKMVSANMKWVMREEQKAKKKWKTVMSDDDEKILKYHKTKDGEFVATVTKKQDLFLAPSLKEKYRQHKLLVGEKVKASDRRERIDEFYKKIIRPGETPNMFLYDMPPPEPPKRQHRAGGQRSQFGAMYDSFKDKDMINPLHADSYEAMKDVAYLRVIEDDGLQQIPIEPE